VRVLFCTSDKIGARLIRLITWSKWSHVAIIDGAEVIEAVWPKVRVSRLEDILEKSTRWSIVEVPCDNEKAIAAARSQIGKPYDLLGMLGLAFHRNWQDDSAWWCSEFAAWVVMHGGLKQFRDGAMHRITPEHKWMLNYPVVRQLTR
jgi:uncharacterized protein YycO